MQQKTKRAYSVTNSEMSAVLWGISVFVLLMVVIQINGMRVQVAVGNPGLAASFSFMMSLIVISVFFSLISMVIPNYQISKYNLNVLIDRITNDDWIGWIRFSRDKRLLFHTVKKDSMGRTKGVVHGKKATVVNWGDYTVTGPNGNKLICVSDLISQNDNLEENVGWNLVHKHFGGVIGYKAYEKALDSGEMLFDDLTESKKTKDKKVEAGEEDD